MVMATPLVEGPKDGWWVGFVSVQMGRGADGSDGGGSRFLWDRQRPVWMDDVLGAARLQGLGVQPQGGPRTLGAHSGEGRGLQASASGAFLTLGNLRLKAAP